MTTYTVFLATRNPQGNDIPCDASGYPMDGWAGKYPPALRLGSLAEARALAALAKTHGYQPSVLQFYPPRDGYPVGSWGSPGSGKVETFKCATGAGWGILVDGNMDCNIAYSRTETEAREKGIAAYPGVDVLTSHDVGHHAHTK